MEWVKGDGAHPARSFKGKNSHGHEVVDHHLHRSLTPIRARRSHSTSEPVMPVAHWRYDIESTGDGACRVDRAHLGQVGRVGSASPRDGDRRQGPRVTANAKHIKLTLCSG